MTAKEYIPFCPFLQCKTMCQVVAYRRLKTIDNSKLLAEKVVAIAYGRWSFTRDSSIRL